MRCRPLPRIELEAGGRVFRKMNTPLPVAPTPTDILILHSSVDGHTRSICEYLQRRLAQCGALVSLHSLEEFVPAGHAPALVIIGASIRYGHHRPALRRLVEQHRDWLGARHSAFFSVCLTARKPGKDTPDGNAYVRTFLHRSTWQPDLAAVFAGKLDYARYSWPDRLMIQLIMRLTGGPTDPASCICYTDWQAVERFAEACLTLPHTSGDLPCTVQA